MKHSLKLNVIIGLFLLAAPSVANADWHGNNGSHGNSHGSSGNWHDGHGHDHGHDHSFVGINFSVWPDTYYYGGPYYPPADQVLISPPAYQPVVANGATYYLNNGTYYAYNGYEYQAVASPVMPMVQQPEVIEPPAVADSADSITLNIPNDRGSYTAVTLKKSASGYTGPQGELYTEFPTVAKLRIIYGK